jgi:aminocarboxymuconate-semialdehyde decarboxylase
MPTYDVHAHIIVPEITRPANPSQGWRPNVVWENGRQFIEWEDRRVSSTRSELVHIDRILAAFDESGIDKALLSPMAALMRSGSPVEEALDACRIQNDALAGLSNSNRDRITALGIVPLQDVSLAITELERLMNLGLKGVEIGSNVGGVYMGDARFRPFWEACQAVNAVVFMHSVESAGRGAMRDYYMWNVIGNPVETTIAAGHLILSGTMDAYPDLKIILAHGGGVLPYLRGRLDRGHTVRKEIAESIPLKPSEYLKRFYFDTITHDPQVLRWLVEFAGADHVLLGSDYPFDMGVERPADVVHAAGFDGEVAEQILCGNAERLLQ